MKAVQSAWVMLRLAMRQMRSLHEFELRSHSRTVLSALAGGQGLAVRAEGHAQHAAGVAAEGLADGGGSLRVGDVPQPHGLVIAGGGRGLAGRAERHAVHVVSVAVQGRNKRKVEVQRAELSATCSRVGSVR